jgi:hypothetical protein
MAFVYGGELNAAIQRARVDGAAMGVPDAEASK